MHPISPKHLLLFVLLAGIARIVSLFPPVIDHDESTYIIIADQLLQGFLPYVDNLDVKPIGIYLLFAALLKISSSILVIRISAVVAIGLTAYFLAKAHERFFHNTLGLYVALIYILCASLHKWSWSANTEIYFVLFTSIGLFHITKAKSELHYFVAGLIMGLGFLFKYHILFDFATFVLFFVLIPASSISKKLGRSMTLAIGFILPYLACVLFYWKIGQLRQFFFSTYTIPSQYASSPEVSKILSFIGEFYLSFLPLSILFFYGFYCLMYKRKSNQAVIQLLIIWLASGWIGVLVTGKYYFHYYFQTLLPFCFFLPHLSSNVRRKFIQEKLDLLARYLSPLIVVCLLATNSNQILQLYQAPDYLMDAAEIIRKNLKEGKTIYTNDKNILYFLTATKPPTKYIHTSLLYKDDLSQAYEINTVKELKQIIAQKPQFYVLSGERQDLIQSEILDHYHVMKKYAGDITLYGRLD